jgi:hypothetical protein
MKRTWGHDYFHRHIGETFLYNYKNKLLILHFSDDYRFGQSDDFPLYYISFRHIIAIVMNFQIVLLRYLMAMNFWIILIQLLV